MQWEWLPVPRLLLEGKSITELLARVRAEHGEDVTIVAAEKVRSGGIGGFFAKESYALTVEVDPDAGEGASDARIHELMDARIPAAGRHSARTDAAAGSEVAAGVAAAGGDAAVGRDTAAHRAARRRDAQAPGTLLDLAAAIDAAEATENSVILATRPMHATVQQPMLSTASPEFASILARLNALDAPLPDDAPEPGTQPGTQPAARPELEAGPRTGTEAGGETAHGPEKDAYARLREALVEIAPHLDLQTSVPLVLVIPPTVLSPDSAAAAPVVVAVPAPAASPLPVLETATAEIATAETPVLEARTAVIPQQGRHRRAAVES
jgi:hypothetical protein